MRDKDLLNDPWDLNKVVSQDRQSLVIGVTESWFYSVAFALSVETCPYCSVYKVSVYVAHIQSAQCDTSDMMFCMFTFGFYY